MAYSRNPTWKDYPDTSTPITAAKLENIESGLTNAASTADSANNLATNATPATRQVLAGAGLTGGGDLSADRSFAVTYGTTAGTATQGNDSRVVNAVPNTRNVTAGTGLTGGGALSADVSLAVAYGTAAGTAAQGNDSRITGAVQKDANTVNVKDHGVKGDGSTDDTAAINAAIQAFPGRTLYFPSGTYMVNATATSTGSGRVPSVGILLNQAGTKLVLDQGTTLKAITTTSGGYAVVCATAADCGIAGGHVVGDLATHATGGSGQQGFGICVLTGGDRFAADGVDVTACWGDGIYVDGSTSATTVTTVTDVQIRGCNARGNRRNGLSLICADRPHVMGGSYSANTGVNPQAGIDVEPNASAGCSVTGFTITGVTASANNGPGIQAVQPAGSTVTGTITGCALNSNSNYGFLGAGGTGTADVTTHGNSAYGNTPGAFSNSITTVRGQYAMKQTATLASGWTGACNVWDRGADIVISANLTSPSTAISSTNTLMCTLPTSCQPSTTGYGVVRNRTANTQFDLQVNGDGTCNALSLTTTGASTVIFQVTIAK